MNVNEKVSFRTTASSNWNSLLKLICVYMYNSFFFKTPKVLDMYIHIIFLHIISGSLQTLLFNFYILAMSHSMQESSSLTIRDQTHGPCYGSTVSTTGLPGKSLDTLNYFHGYISRSEGPRWKTPDVFTWFFLTA